MAVSPSGNRLATISISGQLTLWNLPSLKVQKTCLPNELVWILYHLLCFTQPCSTAMAFINKRLASALHFKILPSTITSALFEYNVSI